MTQINSEVLDINLVKKIAWVTGVNQGIGAQIMQQLIAQNIYVVGFDLSIRNFMTDRKSVV